MSPPTSPTGDRHTVFISYSHLDEPWKDRVVKHLRVLEPAGVLEVWDDHQISGGDDWLAEIQGAMDRAAVAVLLISADFLGSKFILETEIPYLLQRQKTGGLRVIPLIARPCAWKGVAWLSSIGCRPKDGQPLSGGNEHQVEEALSSLAQEIQDHLGTAPKPRSLSIAPRLDLGRLPTIGPEFVGRAAEPEDRALEAWKDRLAFLLEQEAVVSDPSQKFTLSRQIKEAREKIKEISAEGDQSLSSAPHLDLGRLPTTGPRFVGREADIVQLDKAWDSPELHVLTLVAFGGVGKSALVSRWLDSRAAVGWPGVRRALDWSFYSQGTEERVASADRFLDHALRSFGDPDPTAGSPRDRGLRLAELVRREKTLLVLDGVEPLQHPPGPLAGRLKDTGLAALLKGLAVENPGLCLVTTREHITDLDPFPSAAPQWDLEHLTNKAGAKLLHQLGVKGEPKELRAASGEMGGNALALTLLGNYLHKACGGDVRRREAVNLGQADARQGSHAFHIIRTYARWLEEGPEVAILRLLGLFDRPAEEARLAALRAKPAIPGLTEALVDISNEKWNWAVSSLQEHGLLLPADPHQAGVLDAHPLVRAYFQEELNNGLPEAWREGNLRLYEHLKAVRPELPETLKELEPLFSAVLHGCRAGRQQEALDEVYKRRILLGQETYSGNKFGAIGSELTALSGFFDQRWDKPSILLNPADQAFVLNEAASDLRALGMLKEAVQPMQAGLNARIEQRDWKKAAISAGNLSGLTLTLGEVLRAVELGKQSVDLADRSGDSLQRMSTRATLADALQQAGEWEASTKACREAEVIQMERQPSYPRLYGKWGYRYCDLVMSLAEPEDGGELGGIVANPRRARRFRELCLEMRERGKQFLEWRERSDFLLSPLEVALDHLTLGRAHLGLALTASAPEKPGEEALAEFSRSAEHLAHAMAGLRQTGREDCLPWGLLGRATLRRFRGDLTSAAADLNEALAIAERDSMRLHECDAHLEWARLCLLKGNTRAARGHVAVARKIVAETGYGRREREVGWLERKLSEMAVPPGD